MRRASLQSAIRNPQSAISYDLARLRPALKPFRLHWFPRLRSTNDHAAALRTRGTLYAPAVVLTGHQTAGRGRGEHTWWSRPGCVTVTFVFPIDEQVEPYQVPLLAGLAVRNAAAALAGETGVELKWPNDVLFKGRKLAGLLCERKERADLIGLGLNVNLDSAEAPAALRDRVTSLSAIAGRPLDLTDTLAAVARSVHDLVTHKAERVFTTVLREYDSHHALVGKKVAVDLGHGARAAGRCEGLDEIGRLLLRDRGGKLTRVIAGHVTLQ
jgi:BirA family biotin operon repressor/biotin-[acetyl-CoA-carboxylase] ligase